MATRQKIQQKLPFGLDVIAHYRCRYRYPLAGVSRVALQDKMRARGMANTTGGWARGGLVL